MNNMEIKVDDKVRVREDAPRLYTRGLWEVFEKRDSNVDSVEDGTAVISTGPHIIAIPLKYLIKVEEEKKEAKIKLGDMVRVKGNLHEPFCLDADLHLEITNIPPHAVSQKEWKVIRVENRRDCAGHIYTLNNGDSFIHNIPEDCVELVEPTEQTEAEKNDADNLKKVAEEWANEVSNAIEEYGDAMCKIYVEAHNEAYWDAYTADLAKEVALKVANKKMDNHPEEIGAYAVSVAKAVVEGLKRK